MDISLSLYIPASDAATHDKRLRSEVLELYWQRMRHPFLDGERIDEKKRRGQLSNRRQFKVIKISTILFDKLASPNKTFFFSIKM